MTPILTPALIARVAKAEWENRRRQFGGQSDDWGHLKEQDREMICDQVKSLCEAVASEIVEACAKVAEADLRAAFAAGCEQGSDEATAYEWGARSHQSKDAAFAEFLNDRRIDVERAALAQGKMAIW